MNHHPEQKQHEVFLGNTTSTGEIPHHLQKLKTVRLGFTAYYLDGKIIPKSYTPSLRPLFINKTECNSYDAIMMSRKNS